MRTSELSQALLQIIGQMRSGDPAYDPDRAIVLLRLAADRLDSASRSSTVGTHGGAFDHARKQGNTQALDFALGAWWHAEQIEKGLL